MHVTHRLMTPPPQVPTDPKALPLLDSVRSNVGPDAADLDDQFIGKFLKARNYNVEAASTMLKKHLVWRAENNVDNVQLEYFGATKDRPDIHQLYQSGFYGLDRYETEPYWEGKRGTPVVGMGGLLWCF